MIPEYKNNKKIMEGKSGLDYDLDAKAFTLDGDRWDEMININSILYHSL